MIPEPKADRQFPTVHFASNDTLDAYQRLVKLLDRAPVPQTEILANLNLFMTRSELSRTLFMIEMYQKVLNTPGVILEFGTRWGRNLALWMTCRSLFEPLNLSRKIIGFDTFMGFPSVSDVDGQSEHIVEGHLSVTPQYAEYLEELLSVHQALSPQPHLQTYTIIKGDIIETLPAYFSDHPETIVSLAYFDVDLYEPTKRSLEVIKDRIAVGSVIGFDELNLEDYPGETIALKEVFGFTKYRLHRDPISGHRAYMIVE